MTDRAVLEEVVRGVYAARNANDVDGILRHLEPDCRFRIVGNRLGPITIAVDTPNAVRGMLEDLIANWDITGMDTVGLHVDGDTVIVHRAGTIRFIPSDRRESTEIIDKFTFRDRRITDVTEFVDTLFVAETVGLLPG
ncbi:nuclear transport factor 2 family protein [Ensifer sp.]|jgi:ketosteroid isomerase-like protein|uniref:nuclear transport factor 2 family protein n=1 Tax=Ensifer sp. TaxID=1872086 RepID=UPI002E0E6BCA|nr:nuclear transport factor 2 family protein [Ensifer sp.]